MKIGENKRCPRCNTKMNKNIVICPTCQLNFDRFYEATNAKAKENMHSKDKIIMRTGYPLDIKKWQMILLTILLGFTGAHYYFVGRYKMGIFFTTFFSVGVINTILTSAFNMTPTGSLWEVFNLMVLIWGLVILLWIFDIIKIIFNRFKIPVSR